MTSEMQLPGVPTFCRHYAVMPGGNDGSIVYSLIIATQLMPYIFTGPIPSIFLSPQITLHLTQ